MAILPVYKHHELTLATKSKEPSTGDLRQLLGALALSDDRVLVQSERTAKTFEWVMAGMQEHLASVVAENQRLRGQLVASEGQHRALAILHAAEVEALKQKADSSEQLVVAMRKEMHRGSQNAKKLLHRAQRLTVETATQAEARLAAAVQAEKTQAGAERKQLEAQLSAKTRKIHRLYEAVRGLNSSFCKRMFVYPDPSSWKSIVNRQMTFTVDEVLKLTSTHFKEYVSDINMVKRDCQGGDGSCSECNARIKKDMAQPSNSSVIYIGPDWILR